MTFRHATASMDANALQGMAEDVIHEFFPEHSSSPKPIVKIVNHTRSKWLGRATKSDSGNTLIEIQKSVLGDDESASRVIAHEVCHHINFLENKSGHARDFMQKAG